MFTQSSNAFVPGLNPQNFDTSTLYGRFGKGVAGFGPNTGVSWFHRAGMHGAGTRGGWGGIYPGLGLGPGGLLDFSSYSVGSGRTLGSFSNLAGPGFKEQAAHFGKLSASIMRGEMKSASRMAMGGSLLMRSLAPAFTVMDVYRGYQEGGVSGGVIGGVKSLALQYAVGVGLRTAGILGTPLAVAAGVGAAAFGGYKMLEAGEARTRRTHRIEMGKPMMDPFGNAATQRQRSLQLLTNSQINGRSALGTEAALHHISVLR